MAKDETTHDPHQLFFAAIERHDAAHLLVEHDAVVEAMYTAGLAIECLLQALSHLDHPEHDQRHRLDMWLGKCSPHLQETLKSPPIRDDWNRVVSEWDNALRFKSSSQLLGMARKWPAWRTIKGDDQQRLSQFVQTFLESADRVFKKGLAEWKRKANS